MKTVFLPSDEEIAIVYDKGKEAIIELFHQTLSQLVEQAERIQRLEDQKAKDSGNSGKPASSDGLKKKPKSLRQKSGRKSGRQPGHSGHRLETVAEPKYIEVHQAACCSHCQTNLEGGGWKNWKNDRCLTCP